MERKLPSRQQCMRWMKGFSLTPNIIAHSIAVARTARALALSFPKRHHVDVDLVERAALLHDLDKIVTLGDSYVHGLVTLEFLSAKGYPTLARLANNAGLMSHRKLERLDEKIVGYADKRVLETQIVPLEERFAYFSRRYGTDKDPAGRAAMNAYRRIEKELFQELPFAPDDLAALAKKQPLRIAAGG